MPPPWSGMARRASGVLPVIDRPRRGRPARTEARNPLGAELLDVGGSPVQTVNPLSEPALDRLLVTRDRVPFQIEPVVAVVGALDVRGMRTGRLNHDRIDDEAGQYRPVGIGPDD